MTGSTVRSCAARPAGTTAQSSPMPNGARGDAAPSQRRMAAMSFSSPSAATVARGSLPKGCTASEVLAAAGEDEEEGVQVEDCVGDDHGADAAGALVGGGENHREQDQGNEAHQADEVAPVHVQAGKERGRQEVGQAA